MGRKKIEILYIEDDRKRLNTFEKRRLGLFKKARELNILCGVEIAVIILKDSSVYQFTGCGMDQFDRYKMSMGVGKVEEDFTRDNLQDALDKKTQMHKSPPETDISEHQSPNNGFSDDGDDDVTKDSHFMQLLEKRHLRETYEKIKPDDNLPTPSASDSLCQNLDINHNHYETGHYLNLRNVTRRGEAHFPVPVTSDSSNTYNLPSTFSSVRQYCAQDKLSSMSTDVTYPMYSSNSLLSTNMLGNFRIFQNDATARNDDSYCLQDSYFQSRPDSCYSDGSMNVSFKTDLLDTPCVELPPNPVSFSINDGDFLQTKRQKLSKDRIGS